jgi:hypothetical protein
MQRFGMLNPTQEDEPGGDTVELTENSLDELTLLNRRREPDTNLQDTNVIPKEQENIRIPPNVLKATCGPLILVTIYLFVLLILSWLKTLDERFAVDSRVLTILWLSGFVVDALIFSLWATFERVFTAVAVVLWMAFAWSLYALLGSYPIYAILYTVPLFIILCLLCCSCRFGGLKPNIQK